jgi:hypothetical protein
LSWTSIVPPVVRTLLALEKENENVYHDKALENVKK